jgi:hypothetical protein
MNNSNLRPVIPPRSPFLTETLAAMQSEADVDLLRQLQAGDPEAAAKTVKRRLVPIDASLGPRLGH